MTGALFSQRYSRPLEQKTLTVDPHVETVHRQGFIHQSLLKTSFSKVAPSEPRYFHKASH
jgi:hypothetical protein